VKTLKNIPTSFKLSAKHRETLDTVAEMNVRMMVPALSDAYRRLMGRTRHENQPKTQKKSAVKTAAKLHHDVAPAQ